MLTKHNLTTPKLEQVVNLSTNHMMFTDFIKQLWQIRRDGGFLHTIMTVLSMCIPENLFHARGFLIVARKLNNPPVHKKVAVAGVRSATTDDLHLLAQCGYPPLVLNHWFEQGARAWLIEEEGKLLSCYWLNGNELYPLYDWLVIKSTAEDVWAAWWWVAHDHRKQGLAYKIRLPAVSEYACAGFTQMLGAVDMLNGNSKGGCNKLGFKTVGRLIVLRVLGITLVRFGRSWHIGHWTRDSALELSMDELWRQNE